MKKITFSKPMYRWLFAGMGFHHSEATMTKLMTEEFLNERVLKTYREISPTYARAFIGYADWTKEAMDTFAEYYHKTFAESDCTIYAVPGRIPLHETHEEMEEHCEQVAEKLEYLIKEKDTVLISQYCVTNELSVGNTYAYLASHLDQFKEYQKLLRREFRKKGLSIDLLGTDTSAVQTFWQIDWAANNMDEYTNIYCAHNYENFDMAYDDPKFYQYLYDAYAAPVQTALKHEKRFILGEFGIHTSNHFASKVMRSDVFAGFGDPQAEAEYALMACVQALAAMNAGCMATVYWSFCDYPDPFLPYNGHTPEAKARYETARFSGHGTSVRYNKNGMFRWSEEGDYSARPFLYSLGLMAKFFRKGSRVMAVETENEKILGGAVTNPDKSTSICVINLSAEAEQVCLKAEDFLGKVRKYEYLVDAVPDNEFNDLQGFEYVEDENGDFILNLPPHSMTILTDDYRERIPSAVEGVAVDEQQISWQPVADEEHCYYRVYEDGIQIASTVDTKVVRTVRAEARYQVVSVDKYGNAGQLA